MRCPRVLLDRAEIPGGGGELCLYQRGAVFSITLEGWGLMNSEPHGSEEALGDLACARIADRSKARVLVGGLGMGFTIAAALRQMGPTAEVIVAELVPAVVTWNEGPLAALAGFPLRDARVAIYEGDVAELIQSVSTREPFDAILLDVDNGPRGLTRVSNAWLYSGRGLKAAFDSLRPGGVLAVWSGSPNRGLRRRLGRVGFAVEEVRARARGVRGGARHMIWLALRPQVSPE